MHKQLGFWLFATVVAILAFTHPGETAAAWDALGKAGVTIVGALIFLWLIL